MSTEIKPCVWCGNDGLIIFKPTEGKKYYQVFCILCESFGPWKATGAEAIEAHNQLAALREENDSAKEALEVALATIYSWAIDGHADWCESQCNGDHCTCGHMGAREMLEIPRTALASTAYPRRPGALVTTGGINARDAEGVEK
jgi:hypothetical protein